MERLKLKTLLVDEKNKFKINYYDKKTTCTAKLYFNLPGHDILSEIDLSSTSSCVHFTFDKICVSVSATAKCSERDEYNIERGKYVAKVKAYRKAYAIMANLLEKIIKEIEKQEKLVLAYRDFFRYLDTREAKYISTL